MLAALATSALIVLPLRWALVVAVLCALAPALAHALHPGAVVANSQTVPYLMVSVVFRSVLQFALVWLVAATHELVASRTALAAAAAERERARLEADVRGALERRANAIRRTAREARAALAGPGQAAVLISLDRVLVLSREALADVREVVAGARRNPPASAAADELARGSRLARAPVRAATRNAWLPTAAVLVIVLGYPLTLVLGAWTLAEPEWGTLASIGGLGAGRRALRARGRARRAGPPDPLRPGAVWWLRRRSRPRWSWPATTSGAASRGWARPRARSSSETAGRRTTCSRRCSRSRSFRASATATDSCCSGRASSAGSCSTRPCWARSRRPPSSPLSASWRWWRSWTARVTRSRTRPPTPSACGSPATSTTCSGTA